MYTTTDHHSVSTTAPRAKNIAKKQNQAAMGSLRRGDELRDAPGNSFTQRPT
jgi:hypothetical protein